MGNGIQARQIPTEFESCDWQFNHRGRRPAFWAYTKHGACHWLTNFALVLAQRVEPQQSWRIITSPKHSTVWNGHGLLFDFNFLAMGVPPDECFEMAKKHQLKPGKLMRVCLAKHVSVEKETKLLTMEDLLTAFQE
jgi:hypothetical protein